MNLTDLKKYMEVMPHWCFSGAVHCVSVRGAFAHVSEPRRFWDFMNEVGGEWRGGGGAPWPSEVFTGDSSPGRVVVPGEIRLLTSFFLWNVPVSSTERLLCFLQDITFSKM